MDFQVRQALLDDTAAITDLFKARTGGVWQRMDAAGRVQDVPYDSLTLYERWQHGSTAQHGAWMSIETAALHLNHLLIGNGLTWTAIREGRVVGYAEAYTSIEAAPLHHVLHLAHIVSIPGQTGADDVLLDAVIKGAKALKVQYLTVVRTGDEVAEAVTRRYRLLPLLCVRRFNLPARTGQVFYRAVDHVDANAALINGWGMPIGRLTSARQMWEMTMPRLWETIPEIHARKTHRLRFSAAGQEAVVWSRQGLYDPRSAEIACWTNKGLSVQLVASIKDWAHREGYRTLSVSVTDEYEKILGADAEPDGYSQEIGALDLA